MHQKFTKKQQFSSLRASYDESNMPITAAEYLEASLLPSSSTEMFQKEMRVKAFKTFVWLNRSDTVYDLLINAVTAGPLEQVMWQFMSWQDEAAMVTVGSSRMSVMCSESAPPKLAVKQLLDIMLTGRMSRDHDVTLQELAQGWLLWAWWEGSGEF